MPNQGMTIIAVLEQYRRPPATRPRPLLHIAPGTIIEFLTAQILISAQRRATVPRRPFQ
jgi:hypothetical protein